MAARRRQPAITTCALAGVGVVEASLAFQGDARLSGQLVSTSPAPCAAGRDGLMPVTFSR